MIEINEQKESYINKISETVIVGVGALGVAGYVAYTSAVANAQLVREHLRTLFKPDTTQF